MTTATSEWKRYGMMSRATLMDRGLSRTMSSVPVAHQCGPFHQTQVSVWGCWAPLQCQCSFSVGLPATLKFQCGHLAPHWSSVDSVHLH